MQKVTAMEDAAILVQMIESGVMKKFPFRMNLKDYRKLKKRASFLYKKYGPYKH